MNMKLVSFPWLRTVCGGAEGAGARTHPLHEGFILLALAALCPPHAHHLGVCAQRVCNGKNIVILSRASIIKHLDKLLYVSPHT